MPVVDVVHVMRTYGVHGGERQLSQLFAGTADSRFRNSFFFLYRDPACEDRFATIPDLRLANVFPFCLPPRRSLAVEMLILLLLLPFIQVRFTWMVWRKGAGICIAHGVHAALSCWLAAVLLRRIRFAYIHRGTKSPAGRSRLFRLIYAPYSVVAGVSQASADSLRGLTGDKVPMAIENGIDCSAFEPKLAVPYDAGDRPIFAGIGRLIPGKGFDLLLKAFAIVHHRLPRSELRLAGEGSARDELEQLAAELEVEGAVKFVGYSNDICKFLGGCDIYVCASESEGLSNSVLEAMACGLPSVVAEAPGVSECHVNEITGLVVARTASALAAAMISLAEDSQARQRLGDNARTRVQTCYSIEANRRRFISLYEGLTGSGSKCAGS